MYKLITLLLVLIITPLNFLIAQNSKELIEKAIVKAKEENKYVFVNYTSKSCELSDKFKEQIQNDVCKELYDKSYVIVNVELSKEEAENYLETKSIRNNSFPFWYILDENGNFIDISIDMNGNNIGYPTSKKMVDKYVKILEKTSKMSDKQLHTIANSFHKANNEYYYSSK
ncbi:conserved hypothetical protein [Tenacibaculum sp. 190524A05c]|uniref:hypothetical protein n=1 Tax=Tenacibaculum platacis TaxID=3137852 RepID=UPI0031FB6820